MGCALNQDVLPWGMPNPPSEVDKAYAAAFFDAEGHLKDRRWPAIGNTYPPVLEWLQQLWGGRLAVAKSYSPRAKVFHVLSLRSAEAIRFLTDILPYLKEKQRAASVALKYL